MRDMPAWVINTTIVNAVSQAQTDAKRLELFPRMVDALQSVIDAEDTEEPLTNTEVAAIRNVLTHAKAIGSVLVRGSGTPWFLERQAT